MLSVWYSPPPTVGNESGSGTRVEGKEINLVRTEEDVVLDSPVVRWRRASMRRRSSCVCAWVVVEVVG